MPECIVQRALAALELGSQLLGYFVFVEQLCQIRQCSQRFHRQPSLVILVLDREQRPTFYPSVSDPEILRESLLIVSRSQELVSAPKVIPLLPREIDIPALYRVVVHRNDEQRCGVG